MTEIHQLDTTAGNNTSIDGVNVGEGCDPANLNNIDRSTFGMLARYHAVLNSSLTTGGSANAQTFTSGLGLSAYVNHMFVFRAGFTNTGDVTLNVDSLGSKQIRLPSGTQVWAGGIRAGGVYVVEYNTTLGWFVLLTPPAGLGVNAQTDDYTLAATDSDLLVTMDKATANTLTVPLNATVPLPVGFVFGGQWKGVGATTIQAASGVTVNGVSAGGAQIVRRYGSVWGAKIGTDEWLFGGAHATFAT